jgi:hypothetical protein
VFRQIEIGLIGVSSIMNITDLVSTRKKDYFYIMHLSYNGDERERLWDYAREHDLIGLDLPDDVTDDWIRVREKVKGSIPSIWVRQFDIFCNEMTVGDIVLILSGWDSLLGIAEITECNHRYDRSLSGRELTGFFDHIRRVRWIREYEYAHRIPLSQPIQGFNNTLSTVRPSSQRWSNLTGLNV